VQCSAPLPACIWTGRIDVGDDGSFELQSVVGQAVTAQMVAGVGASGLRIRTRSFGSAAASQTFTGQMTVTITPVAQCTFGPYGGICGPVLFGSLALQDVVRPAPVRQPPEQRGQGPDRPEPCRC
jgi:hypothetical protein